MAAETALHPSATPTKHVHPLRRHVAIDLPYLLALPYPLPLPFPTLPYRSLPYPTLSRLRRRNTPPKTRDYMSPWHDTTLPLLH